MPNKDLSFATVKMQDFITKLIIECKKEVFLLQLQV